MESPFAQPAPPGVPYTGPVWHARLASLETKSPFLRPFQLAGERQPSALAPETFDEETADQQEEYQTGPETATADAFVADADAKAYFTTFPQLGDLTIRKATVLSPAHFESLMDHVLSSDQKNFVIDAEGHPSGLYMPLASGTTCSATKKSFFMLAGIERIQTLMRLADESNTIWERASGTDLDKWRRIVETMHSKTWHKMIGDPWPTETPPVATVAAAKSLARSRISALVDALFPGGVSDKQGRVDGLVKKMLQLQAKGIREIQFRACNIGKDSGTLHEFRRFFGADHLCAPDVRSGIGRVSPSISRGETDALAKRRLTQVYDLPSGRFAILIEVSGVTFKAKCAADTQAAVGEWVAAHLMAHSRYHTGTFPIHFLETQPPVFALDTGYAAHIKCHSSLWEGAVRARELEEEEAHRDEEEIGAAPEETFEFDLAGPDDIETEEEPEAEDAWNRALEQEPTVTEQEAESLDPDLAAGKTGTAGSIGDETEDGVAGEAPAEWAMEWAGAEGESPLSTAGAEESEQDTALAPTADVPASGTLPTPRQLNAEVDRRFREFFPDAPKRLDPNDPKQAKLVDTWLGLRDVIVNEWTDRVFFSFFPHAPKRLDPNRSDDAPLIDFWTDIRRQIRDGPPGRYHWGPQPSATAPTPRRARKVDTAAAPRPRIVDIHNYGGGRFAVDFDSDVTVEAATAFVFPKGAPKGVTVSVYGTRQILFEHVKFDSLSAMPNWLATAFTQATQGVEDDPKRPAAQRPAAQRKGKPHPEIDIDTPEQAKAWIEKVLHGAVEVGHVAELVELFLKMGENIAYRRLVAQVGVAAAERTAWAGAGLSRVMLFHRATAIAEIVGHIARVLSVFGDIALIFWVGYQVIAAFKEEKEAQQRFGYLYGLMWEALGEPDHIRVYKNPGITYSEAELRQAFVAGVAQGRQNVKDPKVRNAIKLWVASYAVENDVDVPSATRGVITAIYNKSQKHKLRWPLEWPTPMPYTGIVGMVAGG